MASRSPAGSTSSRRRARVLVAEDEFLVSEMVAELLTDLGYEVCGTAANGNDVLPMVEQLEPDAVLMDIQMPGADGITATRRLLEAHPVPVVILTAHDDRELLEEATDAGVGAYLLKPPEPAEIERALTVAVARFDDIMKLRALNAELEDALNEIRTLSGLLPICMYCKKIRDDEGYWQEVEHYLQSRMKTDFSHGVCPTCVERYWTQYGDSGDEER